MAKGHKTENWKELFIINNAEKFTAEELAEQLQISKVKIYVFCKKNSITLRSPTLEEKHLKRSKNPSMVRNSKMDTLSTLKATITRPPAQYSNASPYGIATELHNNYEQ